MAVLFDATSSGTGDAAGLAFSTALSACSGGGVGVLPRVLFDAASSAIGPSATGALGGDGLGCARDSVVSSLYDADCLGTAGGGIGARRLETGSNGGLGTGCSEAFGGGGRGTGCS